MCIFTCHNGSRVNSSDLHADSYSIHVCSVNFNFIHTFLPKLFFPEGMGSVFNTRGNSRGVGGGLFLCSQNGNSKKEEELT